MERPRINRTVWLAENDSEFRELVALVLRRYDLEVREFSTGQQILDASYEQPLPDVLVTDHHMPELDGLDAVEVLRRTSVALPVVVVTAFADRAVKARAQRLGATVVEKPCDVYALRRLVLDQVQTEDER